MQFLIADTFTASLARLTGEEQKAVKTTAFDLQMNPLNPGMKLHKLDRAKDPNFWSVRVSSDIRLILHRTEASMLLCYVNHHDDAYRWAERRKLETHPKTGAAQIVEVRETFVDIQVPRYIDAERPSWGRPLLFAHLPDEQLLSYGVPIEWLDEVRKADEMTILDLGVHLPAEAAEMLLTIAIGGPVMAQATPWNLAVLPPANGVISPFEHPDAQRRFRLMANVEELGRALDYPWDAWTVFLHPEQRLLVERDYNGPARVSGSAGTGKTIVALHRAVFLARTNPNARVLLTTFSDTLANALRLKLKRLLSSEPRLSDQIEVYALNTIAERLYKSRIGRDLFVDRVQIQTLLQECSDNQPDQKFSQRFLLSEWDEVVDAWQVETWEAYRDVARLGRKTRLPEKQRAALWLIYEDLLNRLKSQGLITRASMFTRLAFQISENHSSPFDFAIVDEAQDVSIAQLRFLAALGVERTNSLFFAGDLGQRIFQQPFSWKSLGVDVRGRSRTLHVNYRTSHQIRTQADRLLGPEVSDIDGNTEERGNTISVFNGPSPTVSTFDSQEQENHAVAAWLQDCKSAGTDHNEIGVFVRSTAELDRAIAAVAYAGLPYQILDDKVDTLSGHVAISTMHLAKGLEFRVVVVMACDDEVIPLQERIETAVDDSDLEEVYKTERHLLYVACTRARDYLLVTAVKPASEFLDDLTQ